MTDGASRMDEETITFTSRYSRAKCLTAAQAQGMKSPEVIVHPVGTEAYGIAVLREGADKRICVYGKQSKKVELTPAT